MTILDELFGNYELLREQKSILIPAVSRPLIVRAASGTTLVENMHLRAMLNASANGERVLAVAGGLVSILDLANILKAALGAAARRAPGRELPNWLVRAVALFVPELKLVAAELGKKKYVANEMAKRVLGWTLRSNEHDILATGGSLVRLGLVQT